MAITQLPSSDLKVVCLADAIVERYEDSERRGHLRLSPDDVRWLRSTRLKYGPDVRVLDISAGGILVETDRQLRPDANIVFELSGPTNSILMPSKVLRCRVASFADVMRYQGACSFKRPIEIPELLKQAIARNTGAAAAPAAPQPRASASSQKVIARFLDGRLVRGYTADFHPSKPQLHLSAEPHSSDTLFLQLSQLKALFFVRDFNGDQTRVDRHEFGSTSQGRKVVVTFHDGETLIGSTLGYRGEGEGFFVQPADPRSNNLRVFVAPGATQQVRFL
ncbi:MAG TPA: PilZ domain-containing protein [Vicinamibacterales bacterium]